MISILQRLLIECEFTNLVETMLNNTGASKEILPGPQASPDNLHAITDQVLEQHQFS